MKINMKMNTVSVSASFLILTVAIISLGFWQFSAAQGSEIAVCVKKSGLVYVIGTGFKRSDCKKNDQLLSWNTVGTQGPQGAQGPKGDKGDKGDTGDQGEKGEKGAAGENGMSLHLLDANDQDLGILLTADTFNFSAMTTYEPIRGILIGIRMNGQIPIVTNSDPIWFAEDNCVGTPYGRTGNPGATVVLSNGRAFKAISGNLINDADASMLSGNPVTCANHQSQNDLMPMEEVAPLSVPIAWPLRVQSQ